MGRQPQGMDRPGVRQVPEGSGEQGKMETTGFKTICGAPTTFAVKGLTMVMMLMMMMMMKEQDANRVTEIATVLKVLAGPQPRLSGVV